jgi:phage terminase small subunit
MLSELPVKQAWFISEFLTDLNGARAARAAGYSSKSAKEQASRLLTKADVQRLIRARCRETERRLEIARDDVIRGLQTAYNEVREQGDPVAMIAAMREIGRMLGYYRGVCSTPA